MEIVCLVGNYLKQYWAVWLLSSGGPKSLDILLHFKLDAIASVLQKHLQFIICSNSRSDWCLYSNFNTVTISTSIIVTALTALGLLLAFIAFCQQGKSSLAFVLLAILFQGTGFAWAVYVLYQTKSDLNGQASARSGIDESSTKFGGNN